VSKKKIVTPKIGEGVFTAKDVSDILKLPYSKVYYLMNTYWQAYVFGKERNKTVNFLSLIEFYTYYYWREQNIPAQRIKELHHDLSKALKTPHPFASIKAHTIKDDKKRPGKNQMWFDYLGQLMKADNKMQPAFRPIIEPFMGKIRYDDNDLAKLFFPLKNSLNVVVDPERQFGSPIINGSGIRTDVIYRFHLGGESKENIAKMYDLTVTQVNDAISFHQAAA
jgi:uncharacterized protein (DUF433 family)